MVAAINRSHREGYGKAINQKEVWKPDIEEWMLEAADVKIKVIDGSNGI